MSAKTIPRKLGKGHPRLDKRTLRMAAYLGAALPAPPTTADWYSKVSKWGMMLNDDIGDCTCAAAGHMEQSWTANDAKELVIPDPDILAAYEAVGGYKPGDESTDNGAVELDVLNYWRQVGIGGRKIAAFAALNFRNQAHVKQAIQLFGGAYIGLALPASAQDQEVWDYVPDPGDGSSQPNSWGGHAVPVLGYTPEGLTCITWGEVKRMSWTFWNVYCDESYAVLSQDWTNEDGKAPNGFDMATLLKDLGRVTR